MLEKFRFEILLIFPCSTAGCFSLADFAVPRLLIKPSVALKGLPVGLLEMIQVVNDELQWVDSLLRSPACDFLIENLKDNKLVEMVIL